MWRKALFLFEKFLIKDFYLKEIYEDLNFLDKLKEFFLKKFTLQSRIIVSDYILHIYRI